MTHALRTHISPRRLVLVATVLATLTLALVFLTRPAAAKTGTASTASTASAGGCSVHTLYGTYGGNVNGESAATGPASSQILLSLNGNGSGNGKITFMTENIGPLSFPSTITYTVNSDCSGTLTGVTSTETKHFDIIVTNSGRSFQLLGVDAGTVESGTFEHA